MNALETILAELLTGVLAFGAGYLGFRSQPRSRTRAAPTPRTSAERRMPTVDLSDRTRRRRAEAAQWQADFDHLAGVRPTSTIDLSTPEQIARAYRAGLISAPDAYEIIRTRSEEQKRPAPATFRGITVDHAARALQALAAAGPGTIVAPHEHRWAASSSYADGSRWETCTSCGQRRVAKMPAAAHVHGWIVDGRSPQRCATCGEWRVAPGSVR